MRVVICLTLVVSVCACSHLGRRARDSDEPGPNNSPLTFIDPTKKQTKGEKSRSREEKRHGEDLSEARVEAVARAYAMECKEGNLPDRCGLVHDEISTAKYLKRFVRKVCKLDPSEVEGVTDECGARYRKMFFARLVQRYDAVPPSKLKSYCEAHPIECEDGRDLEVWMLKKHNTVVLKEWKERVRALEQGHSARVREIDARVEEEREKRQEELTDSLMELGETLVGELTCKSRKSGDDATWGSCKSR